MALIDNIVAYYKLDNVNDSVASYTLTNNNSVTFDTGLIGNGMNLGASNTNKSLSTSNTLGINGGAISISLWVKVLTPVTSGNYFDLCVQGNVTSDVYYLLRYYNNSGVLTVIARREKYGVGSSEVNSIVDLGTTNWNHLVLTYDTTTVKLYVNGSLIGGLSGSGN